ncbi:hypothetical protein AO904_13595 [Pseudomonas aeruginosa]|nr:hypothetical protein AO904_13595 [Pseudomonas aeruginosa]
MKSSTDVENVPQICGFFRQQHAKSDDIYGGDSGGVIQNEAGTIFQFIRGVFLYSDSDKVRHECRRAMDVVE